MQEISTLFRLKKAKSFGFDLHEEGVIPFISNGLFNNGVVGFVKPQAGERVFTKRSICLSAFCEATVQEPPFLPRGNGGSGLLVLEPIKESMSLEEMLFYASHINLSYRWRFSYGRMVKQDRVSKFMLPEYSNNLDIKKEISSLLPTLPSTGSAMVFQLKTFQIGSIFNVLKGSGIYREDSEAGSTPLISATKMNNGVLDYVDLKPTFQAPSITVERVTGRAFVQLEDFVTVPDDVTILQTKDPNAPPSIYFIAAATLTSNRWRFSYSRKLTRGRLRRLTVKFPYLPNGSIDYERCNKLLESCIGWNEIIRKISDREITFQKTLSTF